MIVDSIEIQKKIDESIEPFMYVCYGKIDDGQELSHFEQMAFDIYLWLFEGGEEPSYE